MASDQLREAIEGALPCYGEERQIENVCRAGHTVACPRLHLDAVVAAVAPLFAAERERREAAEREVKRLTAAIETLVVDEVISAGRARELHGMTVAQQREHWRRLCTRDRAIHLLIDKDGMATVSVEDESRWVVVIKKLHIAGGVTSHIVEPRWIQSCINAALAASDGEEK